MGFTRSALLKPEVEVRLAEQMLPLWTEGKTARDIADILEFGVPNTEFEKLQTFHVWNYRTKFNKGAGDAGTYKHLEQFRGKFRKRGHVGIKKNRHRYKEVPEETMTFKMFKSTLDSVVPKTQYDESWLAQHICKKRAYLIMHYWSPLRKSEIIEREKRDFKIKNNFLEINLQRKKKYYRRADANEPFYLLLDLPMVDEVVDWISHFSADERPFNFSGVTAWQYVKDVFPSLFPHFWRFNFITSGVDNATDVGELIRALLSDTGLDVQTIMSYIMKNPRFRGSINQLRAGIETARRT